MRIHILVRVVGWNMLRTGGENLGFDNIYPSWEGRFEHLNLRTEILFRRNARRVF